MSPNLNLTSFTSIILAISTSSPQPSATISLFYTCSNIPSAVSSTLIRWVLLVRVFWYFAEVSMKISSHLIQLQSDRHFEPLCLQKRIYCGYCLLTYFPYLLLNIFLIKLYDRWWSILRIDLFRVQNFQRPPRGPPRIDFTFIRIRE